MSVALAEPTRDSVRRLLMEVLPTAAELDAFVLDFFPQVYRRFSAGMQTVEKISLLLQVEDCADIVRRLRRRCPGAAAWQGERVGLGSRISAPHLRFYFAAALLAVAVALLAWLIPARRPPPPMAPVPHASSPASAPAAPVAPASFVGPNSGSVIWNSPGAVIRNEIRVK